MAEQYEMGSDGRSGLQNMGNTCYMNSVFQCMGHTDPLRHYLLSTPIETTVNWESMFQNPSQTDGYTAYEFTLLVRQLWANKFSRLRYKELKTTLGQLNPQFSGTNQNDAEELLSCLLTNLNNDLNVRLFDLNMGVPAPDNIALQAVSNWTNQIDRNGQSIILDLFYHQTVQTIICGACNRPRYNFQACSNQSVNFDSDPQRAKQETTLVNMLHMAYGSQTRSDVPMTCDSCGAKTVSLMDDKIWSLPTILIIQIKRSVFADLGFGNWGLVKRTQFVDFPLNGLDMSPYCNPGNQQQGGSTYDLYGVVRHSGGATGGHYISFAKSSHGQHNLNWRLFNDNVITDVTDAEIRTPDAYLLFYSKRGSPSRETTV